MVMANAQHGVGHLLGHVPVVELVVGARLGESNLGRTFKLLTSNCYCGLNVKDTVVLCWYIVEDINVPYGVPLFLTECCAVVHKRQFYVRPTACEKVVIAFNGYVKGVNVIAQKFNVENFRYRGRHANL